MLHLDNAAAQNSGPSKECIRVTRAKQLPRPAYGPNLAPSDFFVFGDIKERLTEFSDTNREELKNAIMVIFNAIDKDAIFAVFESWMRRVQWVIRHHGATTISGQERKTGFLQNRSHHVSHSALCSRSCSIWTPCGMAPSDQRLINSNVFFLLNAL
jgi:hypothetical protein